jgi:hypothetical protein
MTPQARQIIREVAAEHRVDPMKIIGKCRSVPVVHARVEVSKRLEARGYSTNRIGEVLGKDHTTILFYLGRGKKKPTPEKHGPPKWSTARNRGWPKFPKLPPDEPPPPPPPERRKLYLVPYAGADMTAYEWKERRA